MWKMGTRGRRYRPRQEINRCLKYLIFFVNFIFWLCGLTCIVLGVYLYAKDFRAVLEAVDFFFNPSILLIACGCIMFVIAFLGCTGALRENTCMLKTFSFCLFFAYVTLVILAFILFILFYSDTKTAVSLQTLLQTAITKYHENENMRELMDYLQTNLGCCGASSQGYKDWNSNPLYNCSSVNVSPEQCGVPPSCCKSADTNGTALSPVSPPPTVLGTTAQSLQSTADTTRNPRCGFHAQDKAVTELQQALYTDGCLNMLQRAFEGHAVIIGAVIGAIIVPVCLSVTFTNILARQIERQRYLLAKQARKERRRRRRHQSKYRTHSTPAKMILGADAQNRVARHAMEMTTHHEPPPIVKESPSVFFTEPEYSLHKQHQPPPPFPYHEFAHPTPPIEFLYKPEPAGHDRIPRKRKSPKPTKPRPKSMSHSRTRQWRPHRNHMSRFQSDTADYTGPIIVELSSITHDAPPRYDALAMMENDGHRKL